MDAQSDGAIDDDDHGDLEYDVEDGGDASALSLTNSAPSRRGRPTIPKQWTKVISLDFDDLDAIKVYQLASELLLMPNLPLTANTRVKKKWTPYFFSPHFIKEH